MAILPVPIAMAMAAASAALDGAAVGGYPVPSTLPPHSWATVGGQVFIHGCNKDGLFNASALEVAGKFGLMTVEKGQGLSLPGFADSKMAAVAAQWKAHRRAANLPEGWALFYLNAKLDWTFFELNAQMQANPSWAVQRNGATAGSPCFARGDSSFPQPAEGLLCFNHSIPAVREAFVQACVNATRHGFDGCFIDSAGYAQGPPYPGTTNTSIATQAKGCNTSVEAYTAVGTGERALLSELQAAVGPNRLIVAKDAEFGGSEGLVNTVFPLDTFCSCYSCVWGTDSHGGTPYPQVCQAQIELAIRLGKRGQAVLLHGEVNRELAGKPAALAQDFEFALAAYLIAASNSSFFGYSDGWYFGGTTWHAEYDKALGPPLSDAVQGSGAASMTWTRSFQGGTEVAVDVRRHTASIKWGQ